MIHTAGTRIMRVFEVAGLIVGCATAMMAADTITGVAHNQTQNIPAAGDQAILLRLDQGMQEEARTVTSPQGEFALKVSYPEKMHLVRVVHQGVNYDERVTAENAGSVDVSVYDAAAKVRGVTGNIEIMRLGSHGNLLHVSDMIEIRNDSRPPMTQAGEHSFDVYLPAHAKVDSVLAAGSGKIGVMISAAPVAGEPDHYSVNFPLRPGATKFAFNYDLPYGGHAMFITRHAYAMQQFAVMIPLTMRFTPRAPAFQVLPVNSNAYQVEVVNQVKAGPGPEFEISGVGTIPAIEAQAQSPSQAQVRVPQASASSARVGSGAQTQPGHAAAVIASDFSDWTSHSGWWALGAGGLLLAGAYRVFLWPRQRLSGKAITSAAPKNGQPGQGSVPLVEALREEILQLEVDWAHGRISTEEYASAKQALEGTMTRALARARAGERARSA